MASDKQAVQQGTRWAVIRVGAGKREAVDTWRTMGDAEAEAMHLMTRRRSDATYYLVEPAT